MTRIPAAKRGGIFKRMETDDEYLERLVAAKRIHPSTTYRGAMLDEVGDTYKLQRRIVESSAD